MKKILIYICATLFAIASYAQEHMTFKGVPMDCDMETFASKLEVKGFTRIPFGKNHIGRDMVALIGNFAGVDKCCIAIQGTPISKKVWRVGVLFPIEDSWVALKSRYESLKNSYTKKYGKPESFEYFKQPYYDGCGEELQAIALEKSKYESFFFIKPKGGILLMINKAKQVVVSYEDEINSTIHTQEQEKIISNDI